MILTPPMANFMVSENKIATIILNISLYQSCHPGRGKFWPQVHDMTNLDRKTIVCYTNKRA